jgi:hypothetical protein
MRVRTAFSSYNGGYYVCDVSVVAAVTKGLL